MVETFGAIFVPLPVAEVLRLQDWLQARRYLGRDAKKIEVLPGNSYAVVEQYGRSSNVPGWLPSREQVGGLLSFSDQGILPELSLEFGEAFAFIMLDDYVNYQHWQAGKLARVLDG